MVNAAVGFDESTLEPTYELEVGVPGASAGINIAQRLGLNPQIIESRARQRLGSQASDVGQFLDRLHSELREAEAERVALREREQELEREESAWPPKAASEQQAKVREMEKKLESVLRDFEYHAREAVSAVQERAAAQKLSKDAERRIAKLRREFREQFDSTVVAHSHRRRYRRPSRAAASGEARFRGRHGQAEVVGRATARFRAISTTSTSKWKSAP